jgi:LPS export ABC transporter protein LptC
LKSSCRNIILFFFSALLFASCANDLKDVMAIPSNKLSPSQTGDTVTMIYTDSAQLKIVLKANRLLMFEKNVSEPFTVMPKGVYVTFYDNEEKISSTLKANYGIRYEQSKRMEVKYAVEVVNKEGKKLNTEHLIWDEVRKTIYTKADIKITTATEIIMGKGFTSNQDFTKYEIEEITGTLRINNKDIQQ